MFKQNLKLPPETFGCVQQTYVVHKIIVCFHLDFIE